MGKITDNLNIKSGKTKFIKIVKDVMGGKKMDKETIFSYCAMNDKDMCHSFHMDLKKKGKNLILTIKENEKDSVYESALYMIFEGFSKIESEFFFDKSVLKLVQTAKVGLDNKNKPSIKVSGTFLVKLANHFNRLLNVHVGELEDNSRIMINDTPISLMVLSLLRTGKTWYEKLIGYRLLDESIYDSVKIVRNLKYCDLMKYFKEDPDRDFYEMKISEEDIKTVEKIFKKLGVDCTIKMKDLVEMVYGKESKLSNKEKVAFWKAAIDLPKRKSVKDYNIKAMFNVLNRVVSAELSRKTY